MRTLSNVSFVLGFLLAGMLLPGTRGAAGMQPDAVPKGVIKNCSFSQSVIFPGTVREVTVFIPAQYDGSKPACVYVKTDGYNPAEKTFWKR